ncbi:ATP-grasp domain-containing protein [Streptomyces glaucosporus]
MDVRVLTGPHTLDGLDERTVHWYGGPFTARRITDRTGLALLEPPDDWLARLPEEFTGRRIEASTLSKAWELRRPAFVKPPGDKSFPAAVYADGTRLPRTGKRVGPDTPVLISEVVTFAVEYRLFLLDRRIAAGSRYAVHGRLDVAPLHRDRYERHVRRFVRRLLETTGDLLPSAVTVDIGLVRDPESGRGRWAVVEANMPWFSHCYAAPPDAVLDVVLRAAGPRERVLPSDRRFLRPAAHSPLRAPRAP